MRSFATIMLSLAVLSFAGIREAAAQAVQRDPLGPISCFVILDNAEVASQSAVNLCTSALNDSPARCFVEATAQFHELSEQKILSLCTGATSLAPVDCYGKIDQQGWLTEDQIIDFCTTRCPLGPPPPQVSSPECLGVAMEEVQTLSLQSAGELCLGARSVGPVTCYQAGENLHQLPENQLVQMCSERLSCQYQYYAPGSVPAATY